MVAIRDNFSKCCMAGAGGDSVSWARRGGNDDVDEAGSVTRWLVEMQHGAPDAASALWDRYFQRLAAVVRNRLAVAPQGAADESDVALSAFQSFFRGVQEGRFPDLRGRDQLWRVLVVIAKRKAVNLLRHEYAQRRGGGATIGDLVDEITAGEPTPETVAELLDELRQALGVLRSEDPVLAQIAVLKGEGHHNDEIAARLSVTRRTIERKLKRIAILLEDDLRRRDPPTPP